MKSIRYRGAHQFTVESSPEPSIGPHEVLIRPAYVGLCFTDRHWWGGTYGAPGGMIGGHEISGTVLAVGDEAVTGVKVGDRVSIEPNVYCRQCDMCRAGFPLRCSELGILGVRAGFEGGLAELCAVPDYACYVLPEGVSLEAAACAEPACVATRAVRHAGVRIGDDVLVLGGDDYSLFVVSWLRAAGASRIIHVDPMMHRRSAAVELGASVSIDPADVDAVVGELTAVGVDVAYTGCEDYVTESVNYVAQALRSLRMQGTLVPLRMYSADPFGQIAPHDLWLKEITAKTFGAFAGREPVQGGDARSDWALTIEAMADGRLAAPPPGSKIVPFDDLSNDADVEALFESIPHDGTKVLVKVS